jgi:hypothetical protein
LFFASDASRDPFDMFLLIVVPAQSLLNHSDEEIPIHPDLVTNTCSVKAVEFQRD